MTRSIPLILMTGLGQVVYPLCLPVIGHLYSVEEFGMFTAYMAMINVLAPVINLKYDGAILSAKTEEDVLAQMHLCFLAIIAMTGLLALLTGLAMLLFGQALAALILVALFLPAGAALSGMWDVVTAYAVRNDNMRRLSVGRMLQPIVLAVTHVAFGWLGWGEAGLLAGSVLAYFTYAAMVFGTKSARAHLAQLRTIPWRQSLRLAREEASFPKFLMPAHLLTLGAANFPPMAIGALFGPAVAGLYGLAYRIVAAPVQIVCMPVGNVLTGYLGRGAPRMSMIYSVVAALIVLVSLPVLGVGLLAEPIVAVLLPPKWADIAGYVSLLAMGAAVQAITFPFGDSFSLYRRQSTRLKLEAVRFVMVALGLLIPFAMGLPPRDAVAWMVAANTAGFLLLFANAVLHVKSVADTAEDETEKGSAS